MIRAKARWLAPLLALAVGGCAKFPANSGISGTLVTFTLTVASTLNPGYVYIFAINPSTQTNPTTTGPQPVVAPPWGNGFEYCAPPPAADVPNEYYVAWTPSAPNQYTIYQFVDSTLTANYAIGYPYNGVAPSGANNTLQFTIALSQIASSPQVASTYQTLQVNFLTMNQVPLGDSNANKIEDALGDQTNPATVNEPINIPLYTSALYNNATYGNILGPCPDPALDITNFSVQVTTSH